MAATIHRCTDRPAETIVKKGGTSYIFVTGGIDDALRRAQEAARSDDVFVIGARTSPASSSTPGRSTRGDDHVEFLVIRLFDSLSVIRAFAGDNYQAAVVPASARELLASFDETAEHFEVRATPHMSRLPGLLNRPRGGRSIGEQPSAQAERRVRHGVRVDEWVGSLLRDEVMADPASDPP
jgi:hypothetical protein